MVGVARTVETRFIGEEQCCKLTKSPTFTQSNWVGQYSPKHHARISRFGAATITMTLPLTLHWRRDPRLNIALACGTSGLIVLDIDRRSGSSLAQVARSLGKEVLETVRQRIGGGGWHLFFHAPDYIMHGFEVGKLRGLTALPGCEVLGTTAGVLLHPSRHPSGGRYIWEISPWQGEIQEIPDRLTQLIREEYEQNLTRWPIYPTGTYSAPYGEGMLESCLAEFAGIVRYRNIKLHRVSYRLARVVGDGLLDESRVRSELYAAGRVLGLSHNEVRHTIDSAFRRELYVPLVSYAG